VEEILWEIKSSMGGGGGGSFWTARGIRQRCPLSPLFNILMADLEKEMRKVNGKGEE